VHKLKGREPDFPHPVNVDPMRILRPLLLMLTTMLPISPAHAQTPGQSGTPQDGKSPENTRSLGERLFDVVSANNPKVYPGYRVNHAKGGLFEGVLTPSPNAASLTVAAHLQRTPVPMTIRYSNAGGIPDAPDNAPSAAIRAMAMTFQLPDGSSTDLMCINMPFFVVPTPEEFIVFNKAVQASPPGSPKPTRAEEYIANHPATKRFVTFPKPMPQSYGTETYFAIHAYKLINPAGQSHYVRWRIVPEVGNAFRSADEAAKSAPNALLDEMRARVTQGPVKFRLQVQVADPSDVTNDPTVSWPDGRPVVDLGEISVTSPVPNSEEAEKRIGFLPNKTMKGLELSDDPFLAARAAAYGVAYGKRNP
jgi:catalase